MRFLRILIGAILFFFLFMLILSLFNIHPFISSLYSKVEITLFLEDGLPFSSKEALMKRINRLRSGIEIRYQSKEDVLKGLVSQDIINLLEKNPLPSSFKIRLFGKISKEDFEKFISSVQSLEGIEKISFSKESIDFIKKLKDGFLKTLLWVCGIYLFGIIIILSILSLIEVRLYKEEREVLYLTGRTRWSLCLSGLISSMIDGFLGSLLALSLLFLGYTLFGKDLNIFGFEIIFFSFDVILSLLGIGILLGFLAKIPSLFLI